MKWLGIGLLAALLVFLGASALFGPSPEERRQRDADRGLIERCRADQNDTLQELSTRRLLRQGCDKMEADYSAKWGVGP